MPADITHHDLELARDIGKFYADPLGFVMFAYKWDTDPTLQVCELPAPWSMIYGSKYGPDKWACEFLDRIGEQVRANNFDGTHAVKAIQESVVSGHGIGKSAMTAWLVDWIMSTRPMSHGTVTANTAEQLSTKTWAEIAKWTSRCITGHWFDVTTGKGAMKMRHKQHPDDWFCAAQTCREENSEAFAGQHAASATSFYIFDEASAVPDVIEEVSSGGLTDGEPMRFAFGNGTRNSGWFRETFRAQRHRWNNTHVDSREVQITNKKLIEEQIADHGIDSDRIKVRVRGMFPLQSLMQFISEADVDAAWGRHLRKEQYEWAPKILTLDNAWLGDDEGVIGLRQGLHFQILKTFAKNDNDVEVANLLARYEDEHKADAVFIDAGYGTGVYSVGQTNKRDWQLVWFSGASSDPGYLNKRAQMYGAARDWLKAGGAIPEDQTLRSDLTTIETVPRIDEKIQLESKKDLRARNLPSPGRGDALALSFAFPVMAKRDRKPELEGVHNAAPADYDPLADFSKLNRSTLNGSERCCDRAAPSASRGLHTADRRPAARPLDRDASRLPAGRVGRDVPGDAGRGRAVRRVCLRGRPTDRLQHGDHHSAPIQPGRDLLQLGRDLRST